MRFVLISFLFLGWAFYEMSGGSEFDASAVRDARLAAMKAEKEEQREAEPVVVAEAPKVIVDTSPPSDQDVTRVSLNLTTLEPTPAADIEAAVAEAVEEAVPQNVSLVTSSADTPAIIPSLIDPTDGVTETAVEELPVFDDIRTVSGNRVNVRGGPGTDYGIVTRLVRGDAVKVLEDPGTGWVRLEPVNGGPTGWMADFLLVGG